MSSNQNVKNLAKALCLLFKVQAGTELIVLIGNGDEINNQKAIETWVSNNLVYIDELKPKEQLEALQKRLLNESESWSIHS